MVEITRVERERPCRCKQNVNRIRCGHDTVREVYWTVEGVRFYTLKAAKAEAQRLTNKV